MKEKAKLLLKHPFIQGSSIVVLGTFLANILNYFFNLFMIRSLSVSDYSILASIITLIGLPIYFVNSIIPLVFKFAGEYFAKNKLDLAKGLYIKISKLIFLISAITLILFSILISQIGEFFHIDNHQLLFVTALIISLAMLYTVNNAFLQAKLVFKFYVSALILSTLTKLSFGILFVLIGYSVGGAVFAILLSAIIIYLYTFYPIRFIFTHKAEAPRIDVKELFKYGIPSALTTFSLNAFISTDIILTRHFFSGEQAGLYASLALIGKVIFYITQPIAYVMFPIIVQKMSKNEKTLGTFMMAAMIVLGTSIVITTFYYLFPEFTILLFSKPDYLEVSSLLGLFGVYISLYSVAVIISNFYLSIKKTKIYIPTSIAAIAQVLLIFFIHDNIFQVIIISLVITFLLILTLLIYYPYATKKQ